MALDFLPASALPRSKWVMRGLIVCALVMGCVSTEAVNDAAALRGHIQTACPSPVPHKPMTQPPVDANMTNLYYSQDIPAGYASLSVFESGQSALILTANLPGGEEIGRYRHQFSAERAREIAELIRKSGYRGLVTADTMLPGTPTVSIGEGEGDAVPELCGFALPTAPAPIRKLLDDMGPVIQEVTTSPLRAIQARPSPQASDRKGRKIQARVRLHNPGQVDAHIYNPAHRANASSAMTVLRVARDLPEGEFDDERDLDEIQLQPKDIRVTDGQGATLAGEQLVLAPGACVDLLVTRKMYITPQPHRLQLVFHWVEGQLDSEHAVHGQLTADLGKI